MKTIILSALAFAIACVVAGVMIVSRSATPDTTLPAATAARQAAPARTADGTRQAAPPEEAPPAAAPVAEAAPTSPITQSAPPTAPAKAAAKAPTRAASASQGGRPAKEPLQDPLAREALAFVGADPRADEYWFAAINDPDLPAHERQDLIEDLNEEGLSDPKRPGPGDLPLILTRLQLIEMIGPHAMDQVNADASDEAYQDLWRLARIAAGSGERIR
jgi:hypothetical protein